jgi:trk system potassium uptake protein TrkH
MNYRFVFRQLGLLLIVLSTIIMVIGLASWALESSHYGAVALLWSSVVGLIFGGVIYASTLKDEGILGRREALLLVALSWGVGAGLAALPFHLWAQNSPAVAADHPFHSMIDCYFEAMSGMTTTGATVLSDIASLPRGLLLWRAITHWLGGLGIVVLFVAVLPTLGVGGKRLFNVEASGPTQQGVRPRIKETARILWLIYLSLTLIEMVALKLCGMTWFDSVCHTFATLATGGFSTHNASIGHYNKSAIDMVIIVFMILAGINFGLYYQVIRGRSTALWQDPELRLYLGIIFTATLVVVWSIYGSGYQTTTGETAPDGLGRAVRDGLFQVVSLQTTTGYCTANFEQWSFVPKMVLLALMFVGGSAGSTGGGIKVIRILIAFKVMVAEVRRIFQPNIVRPIKVGRATVDPELRLAVIVYILGIVVLCALGAGLLMVLESGSDINFATAATASIATLNNIGPGLARVSAIDNYGWFSPASKMVMCVMMALGRLEMYAILVLFDLRFWQRD